MKWHVDESPTDEKPKEIETDTGYQQPRRTDKPKICPLMSRPMMGNGNVIQLQRVVCLQDDCAFWRPGHKAPATIEWAPNGEPVTVRNEIPGKCGFRSG